MRARESEPGRESKRGKGGGEVFLWTVNFTGRQADIPTESEEVPLGCQVHAKCYHCNTQTYLNAHTYARVHTHASLFRSPCFSVSLVHPLLSHPVDSSATPYGRCAHLQEHQNFDETPRHTQMRHEHTRARVQACVRGMHPIRDMAKRFSERGASGR